MQRRAHQGIALTQFCWWARFALLSKGSALPTLRRR